MSGETYAMPVTSVREVLTVPKLTFIPQMPDYMRGIINVRGTGVPIIDLRKKLGLGETTLDTLTAIIIVELSADDSMNGKELHIGIFADMVKKVINIPADVIELPPKIGTRTDSSYIFGVGHVDGEFIVILDIGMIFMNDNLSTIGGIE
jgi:purine-binding chemotaxis protein CheW